MIDLTPLDVRNKRGDFAKGLRGYEPQEVDSFLELVAERLEGIVRENLQLRERAQALEQQVAAQTEREEAVREALVTAQELRTEIREQARREADKLVEDARTEARRMIAEAEADVRMRLRNSERRADQALSTLADLERRRLRFLNSFRQLLEREMDVVEVEESRPPLEERSFELELGPVPSEVGGERGEADATPILDLSPDSASEGGQPQEEALADEDLPDARESTDAAERAQHGAPGPDGAETEPLPEGAEPTDAQDTPESPPRRTENLLLYLDDDAERGDRD